MNELDPNLLLFCLTLLAIVAIASGKPELAEKAINGLQMLAKDAFNVIRLINRKDK